MAARAGEQQALAVRRLHGHDDRGVLAGEAQGAAGLALARVAGVREAVGAAAAGAEEGEDDGEDLSSEESLGGGGHGTALDLAESGTTRILREGKEQLERYLKTKCKRFHPPGDEIYREKDISIFEVDPKVQRVYCP